MKVAFFASDNSQLSGAFKCLATMVKSLQEDYGVECLVFLPRPGDGTDLLDGMGIKHVMIHSHDWIVPINEQTKFTKKLRWIAEQGANSIALHKIIKTLKNFNPDIIHINTSWDYVGAKAAKYLNIPVIWHIREFLEEDQKMTFWNKKNALDLMSQSKALVAISNSIKNKYQLEFGNKIHVIYDGIDDSYNNDNNILSENIVNFITVGGLYPGKGQDVVIKALKLLEQQGIKNFKYRLVGEGTQKKYLEKLVEHLELNNYVEFCGYSNDTTKYYLKSDVFIMSSIAEAFGRVTVEAMMNGLLVLGRKSAATNEILKNGTYGIMFENEHDLADIMIKVIKDRQRGKLLAIKGKKFANNTFTSKKNTNQIYKLYVELLNTQNVK